MIVADVGGNMAPLAVRDRPIASPNQPAASLVELVPLLQIFKPRSPDEPEVHVKELAPEGQAVGFDGEHLTRDLVPVMLFEEGALSIELHLDRFRRGESR